MRYGLHPDWEFFPRKREGNGRSLEAEPIREEREEREAEAQTAREEAEAARLHDQHPGRWGDHASPLRMRRDLERERAEDRTMGNG